MVDTNNLHIVLTNFWESNVVATAPIVLTFPGSNSMSITITGVAYIGSVTFFTNWVGSISNLTQTKQQGNIVLSNYVGTGGITNVQTNGVNVGVVRTFNFTTGITGSLSGGTANLGVNITGGGGGGNFSTNGSGDAQFWRDVYISGQILVNDLVVTNTFSTLNNIQFTGTGERGIYDLNANIIAVYNESTLFYKFANDYIDVDFNNEIIYLNRPTDVANLQDTTGAMTIFETDNTGYMQVGFSGGDGPQFQFFGNSHALTGNMYFDVYGGGTMYFRWNGTTTSLDLPNGSATPTLTGWQTANAPGNGVTPAGWLEISVSGFGTSYLPFYQ